MTGWGEVLEALHLAPRGARTIRLVVEQRPVVAVPELPVERTSASSITTTSRRSTTTLSFTMSPVAGQPDPDLWRSELWFEAGGARYRTRRAGNATTVVDGTHRWSELGEGRVLRRPVDEQPEQELLLLLATPEVLVGWFRFDEVTKAAALDRPALRLRGTRRHLPLAGALDFLLPGDAIDATVDAATGVLLDLQLRAGATPSFGLQVTEIGVDDFDPDEVLRYVPEPGTRVLTAQELHAEVLERQAQAGFPLGGLGARPALADVTMAVGPPPEDPDAARAAIRHAVEHLTDIDDTDRCPNIQGGDNLADCVRQTRRSPFVGDDGATFECGEIAFVRADEAAVRFRVVVPKAPLGGIDTQGRVLLLDSRWVVDRATACSLFAMAGVTCPPPLPS